MTGHEDSVAVALAGIWDADGHSVAAQASELVPGTQKQEDHWSCRDTKIFDLIFNTTIVNNGFI